VEVQEFEREVLPELRTFVHERGEVYRPLVSVLSEPVDVLHCERVERVCAFRELRGTWSYVKARRGTPSALRVYSVRLGPLPVEGAPLYLFKNGRKVAEAKTDENGRATFRLSVSEPSVSDYTISILPRAAPFKTPLQEAFRFAVWFVTCRVTNRTDRWWRTAGRSFTGELPRMFFHRAPHTVIGLAAPFGTQTFIDVVPVFGERNVTLEYGISAYCNTPEPYPPHDKCVAYRRNTWWRFRIEAFNGKARKTVSGDLNLDRHLRVTFTTDDVSGRVVRPSGAET